MGPQNDCENWRACSNALAISATLRPPKRQGEVEIMQCASPKRQRPSPCPETDPNFPSPGYEAMSCSDIDGVSPRIPSLQDELLQMDWAANIETVVESQDSSHNDLGETSPMICYGSLCHARACFKPQSEAKHIMPANRRFCLLRVVRCDSLYALSTESNKVVAHIDLATCLALRSLEGIHELRLTGVIETATVSQLQEGIVQLSINVYGPFSGADHVGRVLSTASAFLQHPFYLEPSCRGYFNPQMFRVGNQMQNLTHLVGLTERELEDKTISDGIEHILDSLDEMDHFDSPDLELLWEPQGLLTCLNDHQILALKFIQRRESEHHCQTMREKLRHLMNIPRSPYTIHSHCTGGILADVMGLGKTLTMISTILSTLISSRQFLINADYDESGHSPGGTLVVVSSVQVLHVWQTEIAKHVKAGTLKICRFHGGNRPRSPAKLKDFDIVLTTYSTLSSELQNRGVLHQIDWYRVVLDEAHWIRNQSSKQFISAASVKSIRRWCLTGTPIQNSLNDLLSLLSFLHFEPFSSRTIFAQHILEPLAGDTENGSRGLRELLRSICLRRDARLLKLPKSRFECVEVTLQQEERALYDKVVARCARQIDEAVSSRAKIKKYGILFTAMMKLRRLCNHGTFTNSPQPNSIAETVPDLGVAEQGCEFCNGADEDKLELVNQDSLCSECGRELPSTPSLGASTPKILVTLSAEESTRRSNLTTPNGVSNKNTSKGISAKVQAVINRLNRTENGSKSLIFSYWTTTLNLLEQGLKSQGTKYFRIDGNVSHAARLRMLDDFRDNDVPVLLMTVETGAIGLNLTAANYVHIVEPQWNPAVEEQAIARAVRMGQTRSVTVLRYMVKNSIEENIFQLQRRKRNLAKFTFEGVSENSGAPGALDDLQFVLDFGFVR